MVPGLASTRIGPAAGLILSLSVVLNVVQNNNSAAFAHRPESIRQQFVILAGQASSAYPIDGVAQSFPNFQNRMLFPAILWVATRLGALVHLTGPQSYDLLRFGQEVLLFCVALAVLSRLAQGREQAVVLGLGLLTIELILMVYAWDQPADYFDIPLTLLLLLAVLRRRRIWTIAIMAAMCVNRETGIFGGVLWAVVWGLPSVRKWKVVGRPVIAEIGVGVLLSGCAVLMTSAVRYLFGGADALAGGDPAHQTALRILVDGLPRTVATVVGSFRSLQTTLWMWSFAAMLTLPAVWIARNRSQMDSTAWRLLVCLAIITAITPFPGIISELRDWQTSAVIAVVLAVYLESHVCESPAVHTTATAPPGMETRNASSRLATER